MLWVPQKYTDKDKINGEKKQLLLKMHFPQV